MKEELDMNKIVKRTISYVVLVIILLTIVFGTFYTIPAGHRGVLLTFAKPSMEAKGEGLHVKVPLIQAVKKMDGRTQKYEADLTAASKDLQDVNTKIAINYRASPERIPEIYREIGIDYAEKVIYPLEQETNKAITSQYTAEELITKREIVRERMKTTLAEKLLPRGIIVEEISIINFAFGSAFTQAIEAKVTAEQFKLKAEIDLRRIEIEKQQKITQAQAEAESLRLQRQEITGELVKLRQIEMMSKAIDKWDGKMPQVTSGIPFIDVTPSTLIETK